MILALYAGQRPERTGDIPHFVWFLMTECWVKDPPERPTMHQVVCGLDGRHAQLI